MGAISSTHSTLPFTDVLMDTVASVTVNVGKSNNNPKITEAATGGAL